jgi:hypothetical protein
VRAGGRKLSGEVRHGSPGRASLALAESSGHRISNATIRSRNERAGWLRQGFAWAFRAVHRRYLSFCDEVRTHLSSNGRPKTVVGRLKEIPAERLPELPAPNGSQLGCLGRLPPLSLVMPNSFQSLP